MFYSSQKGQSAIILILLILAVGSFFFAGGFKFKGSKHTQDSTMRFSSNDVIPVTKTAKKSNIQLDPIRFCKRVDGDVPTCYPQNKGFCCQPDWAKVLCKFNECVGVDNSDGSLDWMLSYADQAGMPICEWLKNPINYPGDKGHPGFPVGEWCKGCMESDAFLCWGKPVILLYPEKPTLVDVEIKTTGEIFISDPLYPAGGWKNVLANPDGSLIYQNKPYKELFYESKVKNYGTPPTGLIIATDELKTKLPELLYKLGLNYDIETEIPEFMDFWLPKLVALNSKYMYASLIEKEVKEKNDLVIIKPEPDTRIELIVYFKPLDNFVKIKPLTIGPRPVRHGFTMVEWGGTIDSDPIGVDN